MMHLDMNAASKSEYIVIGLDTSDYWRPNSPFEVYTQKGDTVKDTQDRVAEHAAERPHIIYSVVLESDFRAMYRERFLNMFGR